MRLILRAFVDPLLQDGDFGWSQIAELRLGRWHVIVGIGGEDALDHLAHLRLAGQKGFRLDGGVAHIQAQVGLALFGIRPVAEEALVREDGTYIAIELHLRGCCRQQGGEGDDDKKKPVHGWNDSA